MDFSAVKVFSASKARERAELGDRVTEWIKQTNPRVVDKIVCQSSDSEFHCLSIILFYNV
jgi:hypothetical protein